MTPADLAAIGPAAIRAMVEAAESQSGPFWMMDRMKFVRLATLAADLMERVAGAQEVIEAWPAVLALIRDYDESFPYAQLDGDDAKVSRLDCAVTALKGAAK
jgi:hypothetical protein